jgi:hypothetical protein
MMIGQICQLRTNINTKRQIDQLLFIWKSDSIESKRSWVHNGRWNRLIINMFVNKNLRLICSGDLQVTKLHGLINRYHHTNNKIAEHLEDRFWILVKHRCRFLKYLYTCAQIEPVTLGVHWGCEWSFIQQHETEDQSLLTINSERFNERSELLNCLDYFLFKKKARC